MTSCYPSCNWAWQWRAQMFIEPKRLACVRQRIKNSISNWSQPVSPYPLSHPPLNFSTTQAFPSRFYHYNQNTILTFRRYQIAHNQSSDHHHGGHGDPSLPLHPRPEVGRTRGRPVEAAFLSCGLHWLLQLQDPQVLQGVHKGRCCRGCRGSGQGRGACWLHPA